MRSGTKDPVGTRRGLVGIVTVGVLLAGAVAGCAGTGDTYDRATAAALQQKVLALSESAASSDFPAAETRLEELEAANDDALARDEIGDDRHASIASAIELVRGDLDAEIAAADAAEEARVAEEARLAEEARVAEEARLAEEARVAEEARLAEEARTGEGARAGEEARAAAEARAAEAARVAEEKRDKGKGKKDDD